MKKNFENLKARFTQPSIFRAFRKFGAFLRILRFALIPYSSSYYNRKGESGNKKEKRRKREGKEKEKRRKREGKERGK
jgi:hypothetical protein